MATAAAKDRVAPSDEEMRLARAAVAGDAGAFADLYERYEQRTFNLAYRITGSERDAARAVRDAFLSALRRLKSQDDREPAFSYHLFTAAHSACVALMRARPHRLTPESGGSEQVDIRQASMRLPDRQREALALRGLEELSYDAIASIMELNPKAVAQLIFRGRINLSDELRGTTLASVAAPSRECERALPLIAARDDGQLDSVSPDAAWLESHLDGCDRCGLAVEAMRDAAASYASWASVGAPSWLLKETMAKAAELNGAAWHGKAAPPATTKRTTWELPNAPAASQGLSGRRIRLLAGWRRRQRGATLALALAALVLTTGLALALEADNQPPTSAGAVVGAAPRSTATASQAKRNRGAQRRRHAASKGHRSSGKAAKTRTTQSTAPAQTTAATNPIEPGTSTPTAAPPHRPVSHASRPTGKSAVNQKRPVSTPTHSAKTTPTATSVSTPAPAPQTTPTTTVETPAPAEEATGKSSHRHEPPGKPADRPPNR